MSEQVPIYPATNPHVLSNVPIYPNVDDEVKPYGKRGRGHPTKYQGDLTIAMTFEYLDQCEDRYMTVPVYDEKGERIKLVTDEDRDRVRTIFKAAVPTIAGLAVYLGVNSDTVNEWRANHPEYSVTVRTLLDIQETRLIQGAASGLYPPRVANLMLSSNHGYSDKKVVEHQGLTLSDLHSAKKAEERE